MAEGFVVKHCLRHQTSTAGGLRVEPTQEVLVAGRCSAASHRKCDTTRRTSSRFAPPDPGPLPSGRGAGLLPARFAQLKSCSMCLRSVKSIIPLRHSGDPVIQDQLTVAFPILPHYPFGASKHQIGDRAMLAQVREIAFAVPLSK